MQLRQTTRQLIGFAEQESGYPVEVVHDINATRKYRIRSLPGEFSGLQLMSLMYVAFQQIAPGQDVGFDLANEYRMALTLHDENDLASPGSSE